MRADSSGSATTSSSPGPWPWSRWPPIQVRLIGQSCSAGGGEQSEHRFANPISGAIKILINSTHRDPSPGHDVLQPLAGAHEGQSAGQQHVQHYPGRPHVAGLAVCPIGDDFRRHVMRGAHTTCKETGPVQVNCQHRNALKKGRVSLSSGAPHSVAVAQCPSVMNYFTSLVVRCLLLANNTTKANEAETEQIVVGAKHDKTRDWEISG